MALHELATNAVKYGALSNEHGHVKVRWTQEDGVFELNWTEHGGPTVTAPSKTGFGSVLISRVLKAETRGEVTTDFKSDGFCFCLEAPLENLEVDRDSQKSATPGGALN